MSVAVASTVVMNQTPSKKGNISNESGGESGDFLSGEDEKNNESEHQLSETDTSKMTNLWELGHLIKH